MGALTFFKSKAGKISILLFLLVFIVSAFFTVVAVKDNAIKKKDAEISKSQEKIINLELSKETLQNELKYYKEREKLYSSFTDSSLSIKKVEQEALTRYDNEAINFISNDFYNYFSLSEHKICKSAYVSTASKILYTGYYKQKRFNKSVSRECYKNIRVAALV
ncbi:hypothetical protein [uncultured Brachyspira sp.]|uniref:hypothetical protein n=1 Tax=uncultured Brachyspira sp. TaxID=221953 RepID=UPI002590D74A|nr:hypothetical protein [uncultured Brachyspira sp.]